VVNKLSEGGLTRRVALACAIKRDFTEPWLDYDGSTPCNAKPRLKSPSKIVRRLGTVSAVRPRAFFSNAVHVHVHVHVPPQAAPNDERGLKKWE
jgi:hypothetical protein